MCVLLIQKRHVEVEMYLSTFMGTQVHWGDCKSADCDSVGPVGLSSIFLTSSFLPSDATVSDSLTTTVNIRDIIRKVKIHI